MEDYIKENKRKEKFQKKGLQGTRPSKSLIVSGINLEATEVDLFKHFSEKGALVECSLKKDQFQRSLGKAKVTYDRLEDAEKAFKDLNGVEYKGQLIQLRFFSDKPQGQETNRNSKIGKEQNGRFQNGPKNRDSQRSQEYHERRDHKNSKGSSHKRFNNRK